ncbi:MAG TPA: RagB/SusD family nutrient uptake outer membrane protein [Cytophagales bacterium]
MKLSYRISAFLSGALLLGAAGCTDLEDKILDRPTSVPGGSSESLDGVYAQLNPLTDQANTYALQEHSTDEMMGPTRGTDWSDFGTWRRLHQHTWDPLHNQVVDTWDILNTGVFRATQVINGSGGSASTVAQAKFLRAFFTFQVVDLYGQVPIRESNDFNDIPRVLNRVEATDLMIKDLEEALPNLASGTPGRANREAAQFLLAKVYLNRAVYIQNPQQPSGPYNFTAADMNKVIEYCNAIINSGKFALEPKGEYYDNFHWDNTTRSKELIFVVPQEKGTNTNGSTRNRYFMTLHYNNQPGGWNGFTTLADFYNSFEATDDRKGGFVPGLTDSLGLNSGFLIGQQRGPNGQPLNDRGGQPLVFTPEVNLLYSNERAGIRAIKYLPLKGSFDNGGNDYVFFRYADVVLMKAEAILRGGTDPQGATAAQLVNQVRQNRGVSELPTVDAAALLAERGRELYWEGWRRNDMIRFGTFLNPFDQKPNASPAHVVVYPIPQRAIDTNPNLRQNFGYSGGSAGG